MLTGILKWIFKNFVPYIFGISVGVGFFFLLVRVLPILPEASVLSWPMAYMTKETHAPQPATEKTSAGTVIPKALRDPTLINNKTPETPAPQQPKPAETTTALEGKIALDEKSSGTPAGQNLARPTSLATEQPPEENLPEESAEPIAKQETKLATTNPTQTSPVRDKPTGCGIPPSRPGKAMDQYLACQWRENCLNRLSRARKMIERDKKRCPSNGANAQSCLAYYHALEQQYHPSLCGGWPVPQTSRRW